MPAEFASVGPGEEEPELDLHADEAGLAGLQVRLELWREGEGLCLGLDQHRPDVAHLLVGEIQGLPTSGCNRWWSGIVTISIFPLALVLQRIN